MTTPNEELRKLAEAATPQDIDTAEIIEKHKSGERYIECPYCQGSGEHELEANYCNYDGVAIGVEFYGIGKHHGAAEAFFRAANPAKVIELLDRIDRLEAEKEAKSQMLKQLKNRVLAILEAPKDTNSDAKAMREMLREATHINSAITQHLKGTP